MTLEQLATYLWRDMPLSGWIVILSVVLAVAGMVIYLDGRAAMRANSSHSKSVVVTESGKRVVAESYGRGSGFDAGKRQAYLGLATIFFALVALIAQAV